MRNEGRADEEFLCSFPPVSVEIVEGSDPAIFVPGKEERLPGDLDSVIAVRLDSQASANAPRAIFFAAGTARDTAVASVPERHFPSTSRTDATRSGRACRKRDIFAHTQFNGDWQAHRISATKSRARKTTNELVPPALNMKNAL